MVSYTFLGAKMLRVRRLAFLVISGFLTIVLYTCVRYHLQIKDINTRDAVERPAKCETHFTGKCSNVERLEMAR